MSRRMKAGVFHGPLDIRIEEIDRPTIEPGFVIVENKVSGICGSDVHRYRGEWDQPRKVATGHEFSGIVVEVGSGVNEVAVGDRVCPECFSHCGHCGFCRIGQYNLCENIRFISREGGGGFAEYSLLPASSIFKLPDTLSFEEGALIEPIAVAHRSVLRTNVRYHNSVGILGAGTIGLGCVAVAKAIGIREILITAKYEHQAKMAEALGADHIVRVPTHDLEIEVQKRVNQGVVDAVIDTVAVEQTFYDALRMIRRGGTLCLVGGYTHALNLSLRPIVSKELQVLGSLCYSYSGLTKDFDAVIAIVAARKVDVRELITHRFPLDEIDKAFRVATDKTSGSIKVLINQ